MAVNQPGGVVWDVICRVFGGSPWPSVQPDDLRALAQTYGDFAAALEALGPEAIQAAAQLVNVAPSEMTSSLLRSTAITADSVASAALVARTQQQHLLSAAEDIEFTEIRIVAMVAISTILFVSTFGLGELPGLVLGNALKIVLGDFLGLAARLGAKQVVEAEVETVLERIVAGAANQAGEAAARNSFRDVAKSVAFDALVRQGPGMAIPDAVAMAVTGDWDPKRLAQDFLTGAIMSPLTAVANVPITRSMRALFGEQAPRGLLGVLTAGSANHALNGLTAVVSMPIAAHIASGDFDLGSLVADEKRDFASGAEFMLGRSLGLLTAKRFSGLTGVGDATGKLISRGIDKLVIADPMKVDQTSVPERFDASVHPSPPELATRPEGDPAADGPAAAPAPHDAPAVRSDGIATTPTAAPREDAVASRAAEPDARTGEPARTVHLKDDAPAAPQRTAENRSAAHAEPAPAREAPSRRDGVAATRDGQPDRGPSPADRSREAAPSPARNEASAAPARRGERPQAHEEVEPGARSDVDGVAGRPEPDTARAPTSTHDPGHDVTTREPMAHANERSVETHEAKPGDETAGAAPERHAQSESTVGAAHESARESAREPAVDTGAVAVPAAPDAPAPHPHGASPHDGMTGPAHDQQDPAPAPDAATDAATAPGPTGETRGHDGEHGASGATVARAEPAIDAPGVRAEEHPVVQAFSRDSESYLDRHPELRDGDSPTVRRPALEAITGHDTEANTQRLAILHEALREYLVERNGPDAKPFAEQVQAVLALAHDRVVNMHAGEGKDYVFLLASALRALDRGSASFITASEELAKQALDQFKQVLEPLGIDVVRVDANVKLRPSDRPTVYVGELKDFAFSALRGHPVPSRSALIDEIDSVLLDQALSAFTLSDGAAGVALKATRDEVYWAHALVETSLGERDFMWHDTDQGRVATLTREAAGRLADRFGTEINHLGVSRIEHAARAKWGVIFDRHFQIHDRKIIIINQINHGVMVDPTTGLETRWNGLAQALEARYELRVRADSDHPLTMTVKDLFSPEYFDHIAGASGTASEVAPAFHHYGLGDVTTVERRMGESNLNLHADVLVRTEAEKLHAMVDEIAAAHQRNQPVLVVTEHNDHVRRLADLLASKYGLRDVGLVDATSMLEAGAARDQHVAGVFAGSGEAGAITLSSRVAGRGMDFRPTKAALEAGGLHVVVGFHSDQSVRIDLQAIYRAARKGEIGSARMFTSLEDSVLRDLSADQRAAVDTYLNGAGEPVRDHFLIPGAYQRASEHFTRRLEAFRDVIAERQEIGERAALDKLTQRANDPATAEVTQLLADPVGAHSGVPARVAAAAAVAAPAGGPAASVLTPTGGPAGSVLAQTVGPVDSTAPTAGPAESGGDPAGASNHDPTSGRHPQPHENTPAQAPDVSSSDAPPSRVASRHTVVTGAPPDRGPAPADSADAIPASAPTAAAAASGQADLAPADARTDHHDGDAHPVVADAADTVAPVSAAHASGAPDVHATPAAEAGPASTPDGAPVDDGRTERELALAGSVYGHAVPLGQFTTAGAQENPAQVSTWLTDVLGADRIDQLAAAAGLTVRAAWDGSELELGIPGEAEFRVRVSPGDAGGRIAHSTAEFRYRGDAPEPLLDPLAGSVEVTVSTRITDRDLLEAALAHEFAELRARYGSARTGPIDQLGPTAAPRAGATLSGHDHGWLGSLRMLHMQLDEARAADTTSDVERDRALRLRDRYTDLLARLGLGADSAGAQARLALIDRKLAAEIATHRTRIELERTQRDLVPSRGRHRSRGGPQPQPFGAQLTAAEQHGVPLQVLTDLRGVGRREATERLADSIEALRRARDARDAAALRDDPPEAIELLDAALVVAQIAVGRAYAATPGGTLRRVLGVVGQTDEIAEASSRMNAAREGFIDAAPMALSSADLQAVRRADSELAQLRASARRRRALLVLTSADGSVQRLTATSDGYRTTLRDEHGTDVDETTVLAPDDRAAQVVMVEAVVADAEQALPFLDASAGPNSSFHVQAALPVDQLRYLRPADQVSRLAALADGPVDAAPPTDALLADVTSDLAALAAHIRGVEDLDFVGPGWLQVRTTGGRRFLAGLRRAELADGRTAQTSFVALAGPTDTAVPTLEVAISAHADVAIVDQFGAARVNDALRHVWARAELAGELATIAAQVDAMGPVGELLPAAPTAPETVAAEIDGLRAALLRPSDPAGIAVAARAIRAAAQLPEAGGVASVLQGVADAADAAAERLGRPIALGRTYGVPDALAPGDEGTLARIAVRISEVQAQAPVALTARDGRRLREVLRRQLGNVLAAAGLDAGIPSRSRRLGLLGDDPDLVQAVERYGVPQASAAQRPLTVDRDWVADTLPGLAGAVGADSIEPVGPDVFDVVTPDHGALRIGVPVVTGAEVPGGLAADVLVALEEQQVADPAELAGRVAGAVAAFQAAVGQGRQTGQSWPEALADLARTYESQPVLTWQALGGGVPDLPVLAPDGTELGAAPPLTIDDRAAIGWLRGYRGAHPAPTWRDDRALREFLSEKGLLTTSPDYRRKLAALRAVDADLADFVTQHNAGRVRRQVHALPDARIETSRGHIPVFDRTDLPALTDWLNAFERDAEDARRLRFDVRDGSDTVEVSRAARPEERFEVRFEVNAGLAPRDVEIVFGVDPGTYVVRTAPGLDRDRGELARIRGIYLCAALHFNTMDDALPPGTVAEMVRREHQFNEATGARMKQTLVRDGVAHLAELITVGVRRADLPEELQPSEKQWGRAKRQSERSVDELTRRLREQLAGGGQESSRVPGPLAYLGGMAFDKSFIGAGNAALGLSFGDTDAINAIGSVLYALFEGASFGHAMRATDLASERDEQSRRRKPADAPTGDATSAAARALHAILGPVLADIATWPISAGVLAEPPWSVHDNDLRVSTTSFKHQLTNRLVFGALSTAEPMAFLGLGAGNWSFAWIAAISAAATFLAQGFTQPMKARYEATNRTVQNDFEAVRRVQSERLHMAWLARQVHDTVVDLAAHRSSEHRVPAEATAAVDRLQITEWLSRQVRTRRPSRAITYGQVLRFRLGELLAPGVLASTIGAFTVPHVTVAAVASSALVNTFLGSLVEAGYADFDQRAVDVRTAQLAHSAFVVSRRAAQRDLAALRQRLWEMMSDGGRALPPLPGAWRGGAVLPEAPAPLMPSFVRRIFPFTALLPGFTEMAVVGGAAAGAVALWNEPGAVETAWVGAVNGLLTSVTGTAGYWPLNRAKAPWAAWQLAGRLVQHLIEQDTATTATLARLEPSGDTGDSDRSPPPGPSVELTGAPAAKTTQALAARWTEITGLPVDADTAARLAALASRIEAAQIARRAAHRDRTEADVASAAAALPQAEQDLARAHQALAVQLGVLRDVGATYRQLGADPAAAMHRADALFQLALRQADQVEELDRRVTALHATVDTAERDLVGEPAQAWLAMNPGVTDRPGGVAAADGEHQRLVADRVPRGADGRYERFTDADRWGPVLNLPQGLEPGREQNDVATAIAHLWTRYGEPTAAPAHTVDRYRIVGDSVQALGGETRGLRRLERTFGVRLQHVDGLDRLERHLAAIGPGATAVVVYPDPQAGYGAVIAEYDAPRGVSYFHWAQGGRLPARPDLGDRISAAVLDADRRARPIPGAGRGLGNVLPPTDAYTTTVAERAAWLHSLAIDFGAQAPPRLSATEAGPLGVLHVTWESPVAGHGVQVGGLGSVVQALTAELAEDSHEVVGLTRQAFDTEATYTVQAVDTPDGRVTILVPPPDEFASEGAIYVDAVRWSSLASERAVRELVDWLSQYPGRRPQVIHAHDWLMGEAATTLADALDIPLVVTVHATEAGRRYGQLDTDDRRAKHIAEWNMIRRADRLIVNSRHMLEEVMWAFQVPPERIDVIPNGADLSAWTIDPASFDRDAVRRERFHAGPTAEVLLYVGRLAEEKGVQDLIAALLDIKQDRPNAVLRIVGDREVNVEGSFARELERQINSAVASGLLAVGDVEFLGRIGPNQGLPQVVAAADVGVIPSRYEPFGVVGNELSAVGLALVASDQIAFVEDGRTGLSFPVRDAPRLAQAVVTALADPQSSARRVQAARDKAYSDEYDWGRIAALTAGAYRAAQIRPRPIEIGPPWLPPGNLFSYARVHVRRPDAEHANVILLRYGEEAHLPDGFDAYGAYWHVPFADTTEIHFEVVVVDGLPLATGGTGLTLPVQSGSRGNEIWLRAGAEGLEQTSRPETKRGYRDAYLVPGGDDPVAALRGAIAEEQARLVADPDAAQSASLAAYADALANVERLAAAAAGPVEAFHRAAEPGERVPAEFDALVDALRKLSAVAFQHAALAERSGGPGPLATLAGGLLDPVRSIGDAVALTSDGQRFDVLTLARTAASQQLEPGHVVRLLRAVPLSGTGVHGLGLSAGQARRLAAQVDDPHHVAFYDSRTGRIFLPPGVSQTALDGQATHELAHGDDLTEDIRRRLDQEFPGLSPAEQREAWAVINERQTYLAVVAAADRLGYDVPPGELVPAPELSLIQSWEQARAEIERRARGLLPGAQAGALLAPEPREVVVTHALAFVRSFADHIGASRNERLMGIGVYTGVSAIDADGSHRLRVTTQYAGPFLIGVRIDPASDAVVALERLADSGGVPEYRTIVNPRRLAEPLAALWATKHGPQRLVAAFASGRIAELAVRWNAASVAERSLDAVARGQARLRSVVDASRPQIAEALRLVDDVLDSVRTPLRDDAPVEGNHLDRDTVDRVASAVRAAATAGADVAITRQLDDLAASLRRFADAFFLGRDRQVPRRDELPGEFAADDYGAATTLRFLAQAVEPTPVGSEVCLRPWPQDRPQTVRALAHLLGEAGLLRSERGASAYEDRRRRLADAGYPDVAVVASLADHNVFHHPPRLVGELQHGSPRSLYGRDAAGTDAIALASDLQSAVVPGTPATEPEFTAFYTAPHQLAREITGIAALEPVGNGWLRMTTTGGYQSAVGLLRTLLGGRTSRAQWPGGLPELPLALAAIDEEPASEAGVASGDPEPDTTRPLETYLVLAKAGGLLAAAAARVEAVGPVVRALAAAAGALAEARQLSDGAQGLLDRAWHPVRRVRDLLRSPTDADELSAAATAVLRGVDVLRTHPELALLVDPLRELGFAAARAATELDRPTALDGPILPGDRPGALAVEDHAILNELWLRARLLDTIEDPVTREYALSLLWDELHAHQLTPEAHRLLDLIAGSGYAHVADLARRPGPRDPRPGGDDPIGSSPEGAGTFDHPIRGAVVERDPIGSAGDTGSGARLSDAYGVRRAHLPGIAGPTVVKQYPNTPENRRLIAIELAVGRIAAQAGVGVPMYGVVELPDSPTGTEVVGFAMGEAPGGFFDEGAGMFGPAAAREAAAHARKINERSYADVETFRDALTARGYEASADIQGFVGPDGRWRPIDFSGWPKPDLRPDELGAENELWFARYLADMRRDQAAADSGIFGGQVIDPPATAPQLRDVVQAAAGVRRVLNGFPGLSWIASHGPGELLVTTERGRRLDVPVRDDPEALPVYLRDLYATERGRPHALAAVTARRIVELAAHHNAVDLVADVQAALAALTGARAALNDSQEAGARIDPVLTMTTRTLAEPHPDERSRQDAHRTAQLVARECRAAAVAAEGDTAQADRLDHAADALDALADAIGPSSPWSDWWAELTDYRVAAVAEVLARVHEAHDGATMRAAFSGLAAMLQLLDDPVERDAQLQHLERAGYADLVNLVRETDPGSNRATETEPGGQDDQRPEPFRPAGQPGRRVHLVADERVAQVLTARVRAVHGLASDQPLDAATEAAITRYTERMLAERARRVSLEQELTHHLDGVLGRLDQARETQLDGRVSERRLQNEFRWETTSAEKAKRVGIELRANAAQRQRDAAEVRRWGEAGADEWDAVRAVRRDLPAQLWRWANPHAGPTARPGGTAPGADFQQQLLTELAATPFSATEALVAAARMLRDIDPGQQINCVRQILAVVHARHGRRPIAPAARTIDGYVVDRDHDLRRAPAERVAALRPLGGEAAGTRLLERELGPIEELVAKSWRGDARPAVLRAGWERLEQHLAEVAERTQDAHGDRRASAVAILIWRDGAAHPVLVAYDDGPGAPVQQRGVTYYDLDADWDVSARLGGPPSDLTHGRLAAVDVIAVDRNMGAAPLSGSRPGLSSPGRQRAPEIRPTGGDAGDESPGETEPPATSSRPDLTRRDESADSPSPIAVDVGALYAEHRPEMVDLAVLFVGDLASAEDVVQDAFMALHRNRAALRHPHAAMAYLRVSVTNRARSLLRHRAVARQHLTAAPDSTESAEEIALLREEHREALAMVRRLPEGQRRVLFLRYWKDLTEREIAEELDISPGGVKSQASRGLAQVEQRLVQER